MCRSCGGRSLTPLDLPASMRVWSWTVNHQPWFPELDVPVVVVLAEDPDDPGVRLLGELRGVSGDDVHIGMAVRPELEEDADGQPFLRFSSVLQGL